MTPGMFEMYVIKSRGFTLEQWREMSLSDRHTELLYAEMEIAHKKAITPKGGGNGRINI